MHMSQLNPNTEMKVTGHGKRSTYIDTNTEDLAEKYEMIKHLYYTIPLMVA